MPSENPHNSKNNDYFEEDEENCCDSPKITEHALRFVYAWNSSRSLQRYL